MLDLQLLKTFLTVLKTGNYSNVTLELDYAQSTITKHIRSYLKNNQSPFVELE